MLISDENKQESHRRITEHSLRWEQSRSRVVNDSEEKAACEKTNFICASDLLIYAFGEKLQTAMGSRCVHVCVLLKRVSY